MKKNKIPAAPIGGKWFAEFGKIADDFMTRLPEDAVPFTAVGVFDLDTLHKGQGMEECAVYQIIESGEKRICCAGIGADWWCEVFCNGKRLLSTMKTGNVLGDFEPENHPFLLPLEKGRNLLAVRIRRGTGNSWGFVCGGSSELPLTTGVALGPWLCNPDAGHMEVRFLTGRGTGAGIEYRKPGDAEWKTVWQLHNWQVLRTENHRVALDAEPGETYEYRVVMRDVEDSSKLVRDNHTYRFIVPDAEKDSVSFLYTADLQYNAQTQRKYLEKMLSALDFASCDFFVFGGDICEYNDLRNDLLEGAIRVMIEQGIPEKPLVFVRGNHELRGREASLFPDFFALPDGRTYGIFRYGSTAFLVLDCWEDKPATSKTHYTQYNFDAEFLREEKAFLEHALRSPKWTSAKRRIVLAHGACYSNFDECAWQPFRLQQMTDEFFHGKNPESRLDLWLSGHSHVHLRSIPGTDILAAPGEPPRPFRTGENDVYPVLTVGGPGKYPVKASCWRVDVSAEKIRVRACCGDGTVFDDAEYLPDGTCRENAAIAHFHCPATAEKENPWLG